MTVRYTSVNTEAEPLGRSLPFELSGQTAKNRFLKSAMAECLASWSSTDPTLVGVPTDEYINLYKKYGENNWGLIITGQIDVDTNLYHMGNVVIGAGHLMQGPRFEKFQRLATVATANGSLLLGQLVHVGRQADVRVSKETIAASAIQLEPRLGMTFAEPREATKADIQNVVESFVHAALYLETAGFSGIQLHAAHGFLLSNFLARATNHRQDEYGGTLENRMRLIVEIADAIKEKVSPNFILAIKINSVEFQENGLTPEEAKVLCRTLEEHQFDLIELTGGTFEGLDFDGKRESTQAREAFFLDFASTIVPVLKKTKSYVSGGFRTVGAMVNALETVDGIGLARPAAQEPSLPRDILAGKIEGAIKPASAFIQGFHLSVAVAGGQLRQISTGRDPVDLSNEELAGKVLAQLQAWTQTPLEERPRYGWPTLQLN
ncbi:hypothetical protein EDB81DRAFT_887740 [Dactylonectria macrodidyma]|uniref:NADH:flavin oxidoreductase/NADH oxidase N-terminal domain-containing protein n=1 Tax=Dactylonectria macrodidyma TaxID=307937 RepID=A0A9P9EB76_9HYPO|nr:hypothetical protein EDB81DRAFT_887740 [Dactylonectria macrodidyma]